MCVLGLLGVSGLGVPRETQKATSDPEISILPSEQSPKWERTNFARLFICEKSARMLRSEGKIFDDIKDPFPVEKTWPIYFASRKFCNKHLPRKKQFTLLLTTEIPF